MGLKFPSCESIEGEVAKEGDRRVVSVVEMIQRRQLYEHGNFFGRGDKVRIVGELKEYFLTDYEISVDVVWDLAGLRCVVTSDEGVRVVAYRNLELVKRTEANARLENIYRGS
jgi:hypothetical protein